MWRWLGFMLLLTGMLAILVATHQPPMRLMPVPLVFEQAGRWMLQANPDLQQNNQIQLFYATNRMPVGEQQNRLYSITPGLDLRLGVTTIRIGDEGSTWDQVYEWSLGQGDTKERPQLVLQRMQEIATVDTRRNSASDPAIREWLQALNAALATSGGDLVIYVHGANSTIERAAGQAAQLRHFTGRNAVVLLFAWPNAENFLIYPRDVETALGSAPKFAQFLAFLMQHSQAKKVDILSYSAGGTVASRGLAHFAKFPHADMSDLGRVIFAAPDADFAQFVQDLKTYAPYTDGVSLKLNPSDFALRVSSFLNQSVRAGRPDLSVLTEAEIGFLRQASAEYGLETLVYTPAIMPSGNRFSHDFWYMDPWVASDVILQLQVGLKASDRGLINGNGGTDLQYWVFPTDYPAKLPQVLQRAGKVALADAHHKQQP